MGKSRLKKLLKLWVFIASLFLVLIGFSSCKTHKEVKNNIYEASYVKESNQTSEKSIDADGIYTSKEEVALYIYTYKRLPKNFITKKEAQKLGWDRSKNNLYEVTGGKSIGGDRFSNYEKLLPEVPGRTYYECDIDYNGKERNAKRIVYADDFDEDYGYIFYTGDHYKSFERLY